VESIYFVMSWLCHRTCEHCYEDRFRPYVRGELETVVETAVDHARFPPMVAQPLCEALARPEVKNVAERVGIDIDRVSASIDALPPESLERAATSARDVNEALVGGASTIVISTTTIIIILLIVILVAVL
jgi:hypothetical protein